MPRQPTARQPCPYGCHLAPNSPHHVVRFGVYHLKRGRRHRFLCRTCGHTFTQTTDTLYHRLRYSQPRIERVAAMSVEGMSRAAIARVEHLDAHTVNRWLERMSSRSKRFNDQVIRKIVIRELQADELQTTGSGKACPTWVFTTIEVWSRLWVSTVIGARTTESTQRLLKDTASRGELVENGLITTDGFQSYSRVIKDVWGASCVYAQVVKTLRNNRIVKVIQKLMIGTSDQLSQALKQSEDSTAVNSSFVERLNLTIRQCCAFLGRRRLSHARDQGQLSDHLELVRWFYNFMRPHRGLKFGKVVRTPAMQAGLITKRLRFRDLFQLTSTQMTHGVINN